MNGKSFWGLLMVFSTLISAQPSARAQDPSPRLLSSELPEKCGVGLCLPAFVRPVTQTRTNELERLPPNTANYVAFNGSNYVMTEFIGRKTSVLIKPADLPTFSVAQCWELVDQADYLYETLKELMDTEPSGSGLLRIAFVDTCGGGCGYVGSKGVELGPYLATGGVWFARGDIADLYPYLVHEMTHNFDIVSPFICYGSDTAHAWTSFMDGYILVANQKGHETTSARSSSPPAELLQKQIDGYFIPFWTQPGATWQTCVRDASCPNLDSKNSQGGFISRLSSLIGPVSTQKGLAELKLAVTTRGLNPAIMSPEQKVDLLLECFSRGAQTNLGKLVQPLHWTISSSMQTQLNTLFGTNNTLSLDNDADGYTPVSGDINDTNAAINPAATEVLNGIDDNCNGIVDDLLTVETTDFPNARSSALAANFPCRIKGAISSLSDADFLKISLSTTTNVLFRLKSTNTFAGWLFLYNSDGSWNSYIFCGANSQCEMRLKLPAGEWRFGIEMNASSAPGPFEVTVSSFTDWPNYTYPGRSTSFNTSSWQLTSMVPSNLIGSSNLKARYWISGFGWVGTNSIPIGAITNAFNWTTVSNVQRDEASCRVQFFRDSTPMSRVTEGMPLSGRIPMTYAGSSNEFKLTWPAIFPGLSPFSSSALLSTWTAVTNIAPFTNGQLSISAPLTNQPMRIFRFQSK